MRGRCLIALRQIGLEKFQPDLFAGVAFSSRMVERFANGFELALDVVMQTGEQLGQSGELTVPCSRVLMGSPLRFPTAIGGTGSGSGTGSSSAPPRGSLPPCSRPSRTSPSGGRKEWRPSLTAARHDGAVELRSGRKNGFAEVEQKNALSVLNQAPGPPNNFCSVSQRQLPRSIW